MLKLLPRNALNRSGGSVGRWLSLPAINVGCSSDVISVLSCARYYHSYILYGGPPSSHRYRQGRNILGSGAASAGTAVRNVNLMGRCLSSNANEPAVGEPGLCFACGSENTYWDGGNLFVCPECNHEWPIGITKQEEQSISAASLHSHVIANGSIDISEVGSIDIKDANGNTLTKGDTVMLTRTLSKALKKGMKVKNIHIGHFADNHNIDCKIPGLGAFLLKSEFVKKIE